MLGSRCTVEIFGKLSSFNIYTGYIINGRERGKSVYIVSHKPINGNTLRAAVIAVAYNDDNEKTKYIVAPEYDCVFYEPQLRPALEKLRNYSFSKLQCYFEKSCGGLVYHFFGDELKVLLVKNHNGKYWSFPKGHIENSENEYETALREIKEETGLDVKFLENFREISDYSPFGKTKKRVVFFLAYSESENVRIQEKEIDEYVWVTVESAKKMCSYENDLRLLSKAEPILLDISKNKNKNQ